MRLLLSALLLCAALSSARQGARDAFDDVASQIGPGNRIVGAPSALGMDAMNPRNNWFGPNAAAGGPGGEDAYSFFPNSRTHAHAMHQAVEAGRASLGGGACAHSQLRGTCVPSSTPSSPAQCQVFAEDLQSVMCPWGHSHPLECCVPGAEGEMPSSCVGMCRRFCGCCHDALAPDTVASVQALGLPVQAICLPPNHRLAALLGPAGPVPSSLWGPSPLEAVRARVDHLQANEVSHAMSKRHTRHMRLGGALVNAEGPPAVAAPLHALLRPSHKARDEGQEAGVVDEDEVGAVDEEDEEDEVGAVDEEDGDEDEAEDEDEDEDEGGDASEAREAEAGEAAAESGRAGGAEGATAERHSGPGAGGASPGGSLDNDDLGE